MTELNKAVYDGWVRTMTSYAGHYPHSPIYPVRLVQVCGECCGSGRESHKPWGKCAACHGSGYPNNQKGR